MGVPVSPRNIFPSNIQGLPTWYEVRVTEKGYLGRRGGVDLMVAMNPQTWDKDVAEIEPGGYLFYDNTKPLPPSRVPPRHPRDRRAAHRDLQRGLQRPARAPAAEEHHVRRARWRRCSTSTTTSIPKLLGEQYKGKDKLIKPNLDAYQKGYDYASDASRRCGRPACAPRRQCRRPHLRRGQRGGRAGRRVRRRHGLRLVSDHAVLVGRRGLPELLLEAARRQGNRQEQRSRSCRPRTSWLRSAWSSAPAGTARAHSPPPPARACR